MEEKIKEMIAIGASVAAHCQPCLEWHVKKAKEVGLSLEEIKECVKIGEMVGRGAESAMKRFSESLLSE